MTRLYLAGPMRGLPLFNFPAFDTAAALLREAGFDVFNPAEHDRETIALDGRTIAELTIRECMAVDTAWICANADGVAYLPGSHRSKGALAEIALAEALGIPALPHGSWLVRQQLHGAFNA